jgi:hypothetical protein
VRRIEARLGALWKKYANAERTRRAAGDLSAARSYFYRADASGQILDVNDAHITDMVDRGVVDEFVLAAWGGASGIAQFTGDVTAGPGCGRRQHKYNYPDKVTAPVLTAHRDWRPPTSGCADLRRATN